LALRHPFWIFFVAVCSFIWKESKPGRCLIASIARRPWAETV
jgi:hypothetical protein